MVSKSRQNSLATRTLADGPYWKRVLVRVLASLVPLPNSVFLLQQFFIILIGGR